MKMLTEFGRLLLSVIGRLKKKDDASGTKATGKDDTSVNHEKTNTLIWGVMDGPYHTSDFPEEDLEAMGMDPEADLWMIVCKIEEHGQIGLANYWYQSLDEALKVKWHFDKHIEPLEVFE